MVGAVAAAWLLYRLNRSVWGELLLREIPGAVIIAVAGADYRRRLRDILLARRAADLQKPEHADSDDWERRFSAQVGRACGTCGDLIGDEYWQARVITECIGRIPEDRDLMFWHGRCGEPDASVARFLRGYGWS